MGNKEMTFTEKAKDWVKKHKKGLIRAGIGIAISTAAGLIIGYYLSDKDSSSSHFNPLPEENDETELTKPISFLDNQEDSFDFEKPTRKIIYPYDVKMHKRTLPENWHASEEKKRTAAANGFELNDNETWVKEHTNGPKAA